MTKKDLIAAVANANPCLPKSIIEQSVHLFFDMIIFYLSHHQRVELRGFGIFSIRLRPEHKANNPQTGKILLIPPKFVPFFKPSKTLKENLKQSVVCLTPKPKTGFFSFLSRL